jgi:DNA replication protein DnaC
VLGLLATYHREDLVRALQRATRYRAFSWSAVERILAAQARPRSVRESLLADLTASLADKTLPARLRRYTNPELLIIDEFGFDRIERTECPQAAHLLYKIIASRNQKRSTALVTNVDFDKWGEYLSDGPLAMAFLDRLVEGAIILKVKGKSYRAPEAKAGENSPV